jgi:bifunctional N-acetylglucosamine-1-phosphate-uridyltransferase/glucosamine-1-phosphate-acetyltransferase GlmU-like protein
MDRTIIIPAAGFGKRVGSLESKELLISPTTQKPLIDFSLSLAQKSNATPVVITRLKKRNLIEYLEEKKIQALIVDETKEWADTVLKSKAHWKKFNLLILPDSEFAPLSLIEDMFKQLETKDFVFATFKVEDVTKWGIYHPINENSFSIAEKPHNSFHEQDLAWGLIAFRDTHGEELFSKILESHDDHQYKILNATSSTLYLNHFIDLTRGEL